jgi:hypothetical protein
MPKAYKRYLFAREPSGLVLPGPNGVFVSVDAPNKDKAIARLVANWPTVDKSAWDFIEEIDPEEHTLGRLGEHLDYHTEH